ncbi:MAG: InlB B-repeat-containing protein [Bacteroides sp.]|nr:InlB B-repeat-containing protein [Bacteroides sp.]
MTLEAHWEIISYFISYELNGGVNATDNPTAYTVESPTLQLQNPMREHYTFEGWQEGSQIESGSTGSKTFTAQWSPIEYSITYELNGGTNAVDNPTAYTIESATLQLKNPTREYYNFEGWQEGSQIETGSTGNKTFTAQWSPVEYTISYVLNGGTNHTGNPASYTFESADIILQEPTREGYTFKGWEEGLRIPTGSNGDKVFTAQWNPVEYSIVYLLNGGTNHADNPDGYTIESATIAIQEPTRKGYLFKGWEEGSRIISGSTGNKTFTAQWEIIDYTITYANVNDGENPTANPATYTVETQSFTLRNPERAGYNGSWSEGNTVAKGSIGNKTFTAVWTPIEYAINYNLGGGINHEGNPATYNVESADITIQEPTRKGYLFKGWEEGSRIISGSTGNKTFTAQWEIIDYTITYANVNTGENPTANPATYTVETPTLTLRNPERAGYNGSWGEGNTVAKGSIGNKIFTAVWTPIEYTITYNLGSGINHEGNPATYNVESPNITIQEPTRKGYLFKGWKEGTRIATGSTGNKTFTAQWEIIDYTIAYANVNTGENPTANPAIYTVETPTFTLRNPERAGYNGSWSEGNTVAKGSIGNKTFTAEWTPIEYDINYNLDGGINHEGNPTTYNVESADITIQEPTRKGYLFKGWKEGARIATGSTGNKTFTAQWEIVTYTITYANVNDGENPTANPATYTVETPMFTLRNPERAGYSGSWSEGNTVAKGTIGNKTFTAVWTPIVYTITYVNVRNEEVPEANPRQYTVESPDIVLLPPFREGYTGKWVEDNEIKHGSTGNRVFTARWEENAVASLYFTIDAVGESHITVSGELVYTGTVELGVVIASKESPLITDKGAIVRTMLPDKDFVATIDGLWENTAYCVRAFAIHDGDTLYTPSQFFSTKGTSSYYYVNILNAETRRPLFVDMLVQVLDENQQGVGYFRNNDFRILEDGEDNQSTEIHKYVRKMDEIPFEINTMLVLDYTSSLDGGGQNGFAKIKQAAVNTVRNRMANQKFGLIAFYGTNPNVLVPEFTDDTAYLIEKINSVERPGNTTALFDAYTKGLDLLPKDSTTTNYIRRDFMVVFTDGLDVLWGTESGRNKLEAAVEKRMDYGQRVFTIGVYGNDMSSENIAQQDYVLERLASSTKDFYPDVDINDIQEIFSEIQMEIRRDANSLYKLTYMTPKREGGHTLTLGLADASGSQPTYNFNAQDFESVTYGVFVAPYDSDIEGQSPYGLVSDKEYSVAADKVFQITSYWADVVPQYVVESSDTSVIKAEITDFDKLKIVPAGKTGSAVVSIMDKANYEYVSRMRSATIAPGDASAFKRTFDVSYYGGHVTVAPRKAGFAARFVTNGGVPIPVSQFVTEGPVEEPAISPEKKDYRFIGWYKGDEPWNFEETLTENIILTAKWEETPALAITTGTPTDIQQNTATLTGSIAAASREYEMGFFYDHQYGSYRYKAEAESASGELTAKVNGLLANTVYYVQAYAIAGTDTVLGNQTMFTTRPDKEYYQLTGYPPVATGKPYFVDFLFSVKDADGRGVDYLEDYDFVLKNGGITTSKTSEFFRYTRKMDAIPFRIKTVLMLDNSSSISYKDMETLKKAAIDLVKSKHEKQEFAIVSFSESAIRSCGFTANTDTLIQQISQIQMGASCTGMYESYIEAVNMLPDEYVTKDSILQCFMVLLSDGDETKNKYTRTLEEEAIRERGNKTVYTIGFGQDLKPARLRALASSSYNYFPLENLIEATRVFKDIQYDIMRVANSFYNLTCLTDKRRQHGEIAVDISVGGNTNRSSNNHYSTSYISVGEEEDDIFWYGTYLNIYQNVADVSVAPLNKYGLGLPDELTSKVASDTINCEVLPEDFVLHAVTYGTYVKPKFVWSSSDTSVLEVEGYDFDKARLIYKGKDADLVVVTVTDVSNWRAVADYTYKGVVQPRDSVLYRRSFYVRNIPTSAPEFITATLPNGVYGSEYSSVISAEGRNVTFALSNGELPSGLKLSSQGVISGVPTKVDTFNFTITAANSAHSVTRDYTLVINKAMGAEVDRPTIDQVRGTYFSIHAVSKPGNGQDIEYTVNTKAVPGTLWQDEEVFSNLNYNTSYYVFARAKENDCHYAGVPSNYLSVTTLDENTVDPDWPEMNRDTVKAPVFETQEGTYADSVRIEISCATPGATILYDLYGETPHTVYMGAFYLRESAMITAMAVKDSMVGSAAVAATYIITQGGEPPVVKTVANPEFTPDAGKYEESVYVTLDCATEGATILYSVDGSEPSLVYDSPIRVKKTTTIKAMAEKEGMNNSDIVSAKYTIITSDPSVDNEVDMALASVRVYPNPSVGLFVVEVNCDATVELYASYGRRIGLFEWNAAGKYMVDLRGKPAGIYYLRLITAGYAKTVKLIVR